MGNNNTKNVDLDLEEKVNKALKKIEYDREYSSWKGFSSIILCYINVYIKNNGHSNETYRRILDIYLFYKDALNVVSKKKKKNRMIMEQKNKKRYLSESIQFIQRQLGINMYDEQRKIIAEHNKNYKNLKYKYITNKKLKYYFAMAK